MTENTQEAQASDKELNFRRLQEKYEKQIEQERQATLEERRARVEAERRAQEMENSRRHNDDDDDEEVFVDKKRLEKRLASFGDHQKKQTKEETKQEIHAILEEERWNMWRNQNKDFDDVMKHADKIPEVNPELAETILAMPPGVKRQQLVYHSIKTMGLNQPRSQEQSPQQKIDANRKSPYYQPSGLSASPYAPVGDFSKTGQKQNYDKMKELIARVRI